MTRTILIALSCALSLAGCATSARNCAGWTPPPKANNPARLAAEEEPLSRWVVSTGRYGVAQGCWKAK
jgi:hypothetical protein